MIDYNDLDKFYTGIEMRVIMNCGGMPLELGEDISSLFYKIRIFINVSFIFNLNKTIFC